MNAPVLDIICAACRSTTRPAAACERCGAPPLIDGRFGLVDQLHIDPFGTVWTAIDAAVEPPALETTALLRIAQGPPDEAARAHWVDRATAWLDAQPPAAMAPPLAWGTLPDGRWYRAERRVDGQPLRAGGTRTSALGVIAEVLALLETLHAAGLCHGAITLHSVVRRPDGGLALTGFAPGPQAFGADIAAVAALAQRLSADQFDLETSALLRRMQAEDVDARPTPHEALVEVRKAMRRRPRPSAPPPKERSLLAPLLLLFALAAGAWFWLDGRGGDADFWQGELSGKVWNAIGDAPSRRGQTCTIAVQAADHGRENCHVRVECGGEVIYGSGDAGYARCAGAPVRAIDTRPSSQDTDPRLELAMDRGRLEVSDLRHEEWAVMIDLDIAEFAEE